MHRLALAGKIGDGVMGLMGVMGVMGENANSQRARQIFLLMALLRSDGFAFGFLGMFTFSNKKKFPPGNANPVNHLP